MAPTIDIAAYSDALVVLGTAGVVVPLVRRWGLSPILGYLGAGALLGPLGLGSLIAQYPVLYWFTVVDAKNVAGIAQLGIVFLLFLIGLELSFDRLMSLRRLVFGLGGAQVVLTTALIAVVAAAAGQKASAAIVLGAGLSLSSTAIVLDLLSKQGRLMTNAGRASFAVLLAQDLAVIPILMFVSLAGGSSGPILASLAQALLQAVIALVIIALLGRLLLRPLFRLVATAQSGELFIGAILFVIVGAGVVAVQAGLSMALGAFVAGLLVAETEYRKAIEAVIEPVKGLLLGIFFFTVGMNIDFRELAREPLWLFACVVALILGKTIVLTGLARLFRFSWPAAVETGLLLGPGGEFAFVGIGLATSLGLVEGQVASFALAVTSVSMALTPLLSASARRLAPKLAPRQALDAELAASPAASARHAIVVGYGRVGKVVCALLREHGIPFIATDNDATMVARDRRAGHDVYYGNAADPGFLETCGLMTASGVVMTIGLRDVTDEVVGHVRAMRPDVLIVARARDAEHASHLYAVGATDAVPETIEASLQLSEAALLGLGVAAGPAIASIHEKRDEFRHALQQAAQAAGQAEMRAVKPKRRVAP